MLIHQMFNLHTQLRLLKTVNTKSILLSLAGPGGGVGAPGAPPPNGRGPMIFYAQNAFFSQLFSSLFWPKHAKNDLYYNLQHFFYPLPSPFDKVHAPPPYGQTLEPPLSITYS